MNHIVFTSGATLTDNGNGKVSIAISGGGGGGMTTWTIAGASGSTVVNDGETVTITGSSGITTAESGRTVTITPTGVLEDLNTLGVATGADLFIVSSGAGAFGYQDASATRATLGLGTMATQNANAVAITGGSITGITDLAVADGGTGLGSYTVGDILYASGATTLSKLGIGTAGQVLQVNAGATANGSGRRWRKGTITPAVNFQIPYYSGGGRSVQQPPLKEMPISHINHRVRHSGNRFAVADDFTINADIGSTEKCVMYVNPAGNDINWVFNSRHSIIQVRLHLQSSIHKAQKGRPQTFLNRSHFRSNANRHIGRTCSGSSNALMMEHPLVLVMLLMRGRWVASLKCSSMSILMRRKYH